MKYVYKEDMEIFRKFAVRVFDVGSGQGTTEEIVLEGIKRLISFYSSLGLPTSLEDIGVGKEGLDGMAKKTQLFGPIGRFRELDKQDVLNIFETAL
jgi:alcohol dehydrogenase YqhD (iron-dependent ADH family)